MPPQGSGADAQLSSPVNSSPFWGMLGRIWQGVAGHTYNYSWEWQCTPIIPVLGKQRQRKKAGKESSNPVLFLVLGVLDHVTGVLLLDLETVGEVRTSSLGLSFW